MFSDPTLSSFLWWSQPKTIPAILRLPDELIIEVASHARSWSSLPPNKSNNDDATLQGPSIIDDSPVTLPSDLASLASTCHVLREILTPILLRDVQITSGKRLRSLCAIHPRKLAQIRVLWLHLDCDFFAEFARSLDPQFRTPQHANIRPLSRNAAYPPPPIMKVLCSILLLTPALQSFSIRLAKASSQSSAWKQFSFRTRGIPWKKGFDENMRLVLSEKEKEALNSGIHTPTAFSPPTRSTRDALSRISWPLLTHMHLDGLEDIGSLLRMTPNLTHLVLRMLEGFDSTSSSQFIHDIARASVPNLKSLAFSARCLHLPDREESNARGVELLEEIGQACPGLELLDLRVNSYGPDNLPYATIYHKPSYSALLSALSNLPNLQALHFPGNLLSQEEEELFLTIGFDADERTRPDRRVALSQVAHRESDAMISMASVAPKLKRVSWVRRRDPDRRIEECSVEYAIHRMKMTPRSPSMLLTSPSMSPFSASPRLPILSADPPASAPSESDVDHIDLLHIHPPPRVHEIPRNISSVAQPPSFLGYTKNAQGFNQFTADHPVVSSLLGIAAVVVLTFLIYKDFHTISHIVSIASLVHMLYARTFVTPMALLCIADAATFLTP